MLHNTNQMRTHTLDAIKIAAAIGIYCFHYSEQFEIDIVLFKKTIGSYGYLLVELFFIISGYLMASKEKKIAQTPFSTFFFERIVRIFPFYWVSIAVQYALNIWGTRSILEGMGLWSSLSNTLLLPWTLKNVFTMINPPCWYLIVLLLMYWILWAILYFTSRNGRNPVPFYAILLFLGISSRIGFSPFDIIPDPINRGTTAFFIGCILFHCNRLISGRKTAISAFISLVGCIAAVLLIPGFMDNLYMIITIIIYPALLLFCLNFKWLENILSHKWVEILGRSSFEVFVLNDPFLTLHHRLFFLNIPDEIRGNIFVMLVSTAVLVALSVLCHIYVEKPLTKYFLRLLQNKHFLPINSENNTDPH